jgi:lipopolysaccharide export system permease protein
MGFAPTPNFHLPTPNNHIPGVRHKSDAAFIFTGKGAENPPLCAAQHPLKTLQKYLVGQVFVTLLLTVAVFTAVLLIGNALKEILTLLASAHVSPLILVKAVLYLIPFVWVFALPMGMLTATLLVFGRFSADQELTAARASGVSLMSLIMPVLLLSLFCCTLAAWFNMDVGPQCRVAYLGLIQDVKKEVVNNALPAGRFITDFKGFIFYVEKNDGGKLKNVMIYRMQDETNVDTTIRAPRGEVKPDPANNQIILDLFDAVSVSVAQHGDTIGTVAHYPFVLSTTNSVKRASEPSINDMTFLQLRQKLHLLENLRVPIGTNSPAALQAQLKALRLGKADFTEPVRVAMNRQVAFSFACFGFTLVGIPLGIRVHRRETNIGIAIALVLVLVYYAFIMLGQSLAFHPEFCPHLILWVPNFIFQAMGAVLLWRANRGI